MAKQDYINAFNSFNDIIDLKIHHYGTTGTVHVTNASEYFETDEDGAEEDWANWLDSEGLDQDCSLEDALNDNFPEDSYSVSFELTYESSNDAVQDGNAIEDLKRMLKEVLAKLDNCSPTDEYISEAVKDLNGNIVGDLSLSIEAEQGDLVMDTIKSGFDIGKMFDNVKSKNINSKYDPQFNQLMQHYTGTILKNRRTKKDQLIKIGACIVGYVYDQLNGDKLLLDWSCDLVNNIAKELNR